MYIARSGLARVLTLCLQGLGVSENAAHHSRGHCPVESGQETESCSLPYHGELRWPVYTPGRSSRKVESWRSLRGTIPRPRGLCKQQVKPDDESIARAWMRALGPLGWGKLGKSFHAPPGPQSTQQKNERAGNTDSNSNLPQIGGSLRL